MLKIKWRCTSYFNTNNNDSGWFLYRICFLNSKIQCGDVVNDFFSLVRPRFLIGIAPCRVNEFLWWVGQNEPDLCGEIHARLVKNSGPGKLGRTRYYGLLPPGWSTHQVETWNHDLSSGMAWIVLWIIFLELLWFYY